MTMDRIGLKELVEKGSDTGLLRETIAFVTARSMDMEVESLTGAALGERSADRMNSRNGYRPRLWETRAGSVPLAIPKLRKSLPPRRRGAAISPPSWNRGVPRKRRWWPSFRRPISRASQHAPWMSRSRPWA